LVTQRETGVGDHQTVSASSLLHLGTDGVARRLRPTEPAAAIRPRARSIREEMRGPALPLMKLGKTDDWLRILPASIDGGQFQPASAR
jgi:hypothetical protein